MILNKVSRFLFGSLLVGICTINSVESHGVEVRQCITDRGLLRVFVEHWHGDLSAPSVAGTMQIRDDTDGIGVPQTLFPIGLANNVVNSETDLPGCVGTTELVTTCNNQKRDWVYYDFPTQCNKTVQYTFLQGNTVYLTEGCSHLYPATIVASFVDSSDPIPLINGEVCDGGNIVNANIIEPEDTHAIVLYEMGAYDDCDKNATVESSIPSCSYFPIGDTNVTLTATDSPGFIGTCTFVVRVLNTTAPPVSSPTQSPSQIVCPTLSPSLSPTLNPSVIPTMTPSLFPSAKPSSQPAADPSSSPSIKPSSSPSTFPSLEPSIIPSTAPSIVPSLSPSISRSPTSFPSSTLSDNPSLKPSIQPSTFPSMKPSSPPSSLPSMEPSDIPSTMPSIAPSSNPSISRSPSSSPSMEPSGIPSTMPSIAPSSNPSMSRSPSSLPSVEPSGIPSTMPSIAPSSNPSISRSPSSSPSKTPPLPSTEPATTPSSLPSSIPFVVPSLAPSSSPSMVPSALPTTTPIPSVLPNSNPSVSPSTSLSPSAIPSTSGFPSLMPSSSPTDNPSDVPPCIERNNCNGNGYCARPEVCVCDIGYGGQDCEICDTNYRLVDDKCLECAACENGGICNAIAQCECPDNYGGDTCLTCSEGYFGPDCLPFPFISSTLPSDAPDEGGLNVRISGYNLGSPGNDTEIECDFIGISRVSGELIGNDLVQCQTPQVTLAGSGSRVVSLRLFVNDSASYNHVPFSFYGVCPDSFCAFGFCTFGRCQCYYGYRGDSCDEELTAPQISDPPDVFELIEGTSFTYQLELDGGSLPVDWGIVGIPLEGMSLDAQSGTLQWTNPIARTSTYSIRIQATNDLRSTSVYLKLHVLPSYYVKVTTTEPDTMIRPASQLFFDFETFDRQTNELVGQKLAVLWVNENGNSPNRRRKIMVKTSADGSLQKQYQPYSNDVGKYIYGGEHPTYSNVTEQGSFNIRGVDISPTYYVWRGFPDESVILEDIFSLTFKGGSFTNITATFDTVDDVIMNAELSQDSANQTSSVATMNLQAEVSSNLRGRIYFTVSTNEGILTTSSSYVYIDIRFRTPKIRCLPSSIDIKVVKGGVERYEDFVLENVGSLASDLIQVVVPNQPVIRPVSEYISGIDVDDTVVVSFQVKAPDNLDIGSVFSGTIGFVSTSSTPAYLDYRATIVSSIPANLTIVTQNEATFLSEEKLNLADTNVRVRSLLLGTTYNVNSGINGTVTIMDLVEGYYEIYAQKLGHSSFRTTIFLESPGTTVEAFLEYQAVSYTFTVVEIPVVDRYEIVVKTTFKTNVPKPVILWSPRVLNWDEIDSGLIESFQMSAENVGFIATDDLTWSVPSHWRDKAFLPSGKFNVGRLPANSTITFPVEVVPIKRFQLPDDRAELRSSDMNTILFVPRAGDPVYEEGGIDMIMILKGNELDQWYVKFEEDGMIEFFYSYANSSMYEFVYDDNATVIDVIITHDANLTGTERNRRRLENIPNEVQLLREGNDQNLVDNGNHYKRDDISGSRDLIEITEPLDCARAIACEICNELYEEYLEDKIEELLPPPCNIPSFTFGTSISFGPIDVSVGVVELSSPPMPWDEMCDEIKDNLNPCNHVCPDDITFGGCATFECNGPKTICFEIGIPNIGDCRINLGISPNPSPLSGGCTRCGGGFGFGFDLPDPCKLLPRTRRQLQSSGIIPSHVAPFHRSLLLGCEECSSDELDVVFQEIDIRESILLEAETLMNSCVEDAQSSNNIKSIFPCIVPKIVAFVDLMPLALQVLTCQLGRESCYSTDDLATSPGLVNLFIQSERMKAFVNLALLPFGGKLDATASSAVVPFNENSIINQTQVELLSTLIIDAVSDSGDSGESISPTELSAFLGIGISIPLEVGITQFVTAWNNSLDLWSEGIFTTENLPTNYSSPFFDLEHANKLVNDFTLSRTRVRYENFAGFGDAWLTAVESQQVEEAKQLAGVCASVRVEIRQELTLTRVGFEARLDIQNDGENSLEDVSVTLRVAPFGNITVDATDLFVFGEPELTSLESVSNGTIYPNTNAKVTWLIMALTEAAPVFETKYGISGVLKYTIEGVEYIQNLVPDTITVRPDPQLYLTYFHSREAFSDNPFTPQIEPPIPFQLAVLIENKGYGDAKDVNILSSQPEIVENEKGLLVDFTIIGSRLGNTGASSNSLNIDFGDIPSRSNTVGVWDMISTLRGTFYNFSASFEYKGAINDDRLSLIESVSIYELTHIVRVLGDHPAGTGLGYYDDDQDDFLVNLNPDAFYIPDHVFTSDTRQSNFTVASVVDKARIIDIDDSVPDTISVTVRYNLTVEEQSLLTDWCYIRFDNPLVGNRDDFKLKTVTRTDFDYQLLPKYNSWHTSWTEYLLSGEENENSFIHLFDFGVAPEYILLFKKVSPISNLRIVELTESSLGVAWDGNLQGTSRSIMIKPAGLGDQYYAVVRSYVPTEVSEYTVGNLAKGQSYTIKAISGDDGIFELVGMEVTGQTSGISLCGNSQIDTGELCDDGPLNGSELSNCTDVCVFLLPDLTIKDNEPSFVPSAFPSGVPTGVPSTSNMPSNTPTVDCESIETNFVKCKEHNDVCKWDKGRSSCKYRNCFKLNTGDVCDRSDLCNWDWDLSALKCFTKNEKCMEATDKDACKELFCNFWPVSDGGQCRAQNAGEPSGPIDCEMIDKKKLCLMSSVCKFDKGGLGCQYKNCFKFDTEADCDQSDLCNWVSSSSGCFTKQEKCKEMTTEDECKSIRCKWKPTHSFCKAHEMP